MHLQQKEANPRSLFGSFNFRRVILATTFMIITFISHAQEGDKNANRPLDNGFHVTLHVNGTSGTSNTYGFEIGNSWNVYTLDDIGLAFGITANWLDANIGVESGASDLQTTVSYGSVAGVGPIATYKVMDKFGVGLQYKIKPTIYYSESTSTIISDTETVGFGVIGEFGLFARYDIFQMGFGFGNGTITAQTTTFSTTSDSSIDVDVPLKYTRLFIGFRF